MPVLPYLPAIIGAAGSTAGAIISNKKSNRQQTSIDPAEYNPLKNMLIQQAMSRLQSPDNLSKGYEATGIRNINTGAGLAQQSLENRLGASGLLGSGVHGAGLSNLETRRFGDVNDFRNIELPRLSEDVYNQRFNQASSVFGQRVPGTQFPGSALGTGLQTGGNAATLLGILYGMGAFDKKA